MPNLDYLISEPRIVMILSGIGAADFNFLLSASGMGKISLSAHMSRLRNARYVETISNGDGTAPHLAYRLTESGQKAAAGCLYWLKAIQSVRYCPKRAPRSWMGVVDHSRGENSPLLAIAGRE
jgi:DNA-binding transcriptional ArsR family regulator